MEYFAQHNLEIRQYLQKVGKADKEHSLLEYTYEFSDLRVTEREYEIIQELPHHYF